MEEESNSQDGRIFRLRQKERKHYTEDAINDEEIEGKRMFSVEEKLSSEKFCNFFVKDMKGDEFNLRYLQEHGFESPVVIREKTGLGMRLPSKNFTVNDVRQCVGSRRMLDVMDVTTQKDIEMSMKDWVKYYENPVRDKLLNVISLEFSHTKLENYVESPLVVRDIDWVDRVWPRHLKRSQIEATNIIDDMKYPKVQKYCLMSVKGCYTDFHIDFGGTSVWYHILHGSKVFWLIPPTEKNLQLYETWVLSGKQGDVFFGDTVEKCGRIHLEEGWTFFIPTGWIHAVYTPQDSLVFGGNFLHSFGIEKQLRIAQIEDSTHVPTKFRYPFYTEMLWYVLERYVHCLTGRSHLYLVDVDNEDKEHKLSKEIKREPREAGGPSVADRSNGVLITPPESPRSPIDVEHAAEINFIASPQITNPTIKPKITPTPSSSSILPFAKIVEGTSTSEVPFFGHAFTMTSPQFSPHPEIIVPDGRIDATNVEAVRRILDGVARLHHPSLQPQQSSFEAPQEAAAPPPPQLPLNHTHLTRFEINGLNAIVKWLNALSNSKKNIPDLIKNHVNLLADIKLLLELHKSDDNKLALNGKPILVWPESTKINKSPIILKIRPTKPRPSCSSGGKSKGGGSSKGNSSSRRRRTRCKKCEACLRTDCGECHFCKDMRKFGGPGRMKQSCISRQCMAPVLPHTACCMVCGKDGWEKVDNTEEEVSSLMECSICWEIVHPDCIRNRGNGDGLMNEDLPNSWECPRCCGDGKGGQSKVPRQVKGARHKPSDIIRSPGTPLPPGNNVDVAKGAAVVADVGQPGGTLPVETNENPANVVTSTSSSVSLLESDDKKRKSAEETDLSFIKKKIKVEAPDPDAPPLLQENSSPIGSSLPICVIRRSLYKDEKTPKLDANATSKKRAADTAPLKVVKMEAEAHVRSCSQGRSGDDRQLHPLLRAATMHGNDNLRSRASPRVLAPQNSNNNSNDENVLEMKNKTMMKCQVKVEKCDADILQRKRKSNADLTSPLINEGTRGSRLQTRNAVVQIPRRNLSKQQNQQQQQQQNQQQQQQQLRKPLYVVRPASVVVEKMKIELFDTKDNSTNLALDKDIMMCVFRYLTASDLCRCMRVCRTWSQWCLDSKLWSHVDLTRGKITAAHLAGLVRRQPKSLVLSWSNMSKKLLSWLMSRLPHLRRLDLTGCAASTISALRTCNAPLLSSLQLKFVEGFHDPLLRELLSPPPDSRPGLIESRSRLRNLTSLSLSGCDVTDVSLRYVTQHLRLISHLDLSHCTKLTDAGISLLAAVGSVTRETLVHLDVTGCNKLTDASLEHLKRCVHLCYIDVRSCPEISVSACKKFISHSKITLVMINSKLIERVH